jgi:hypothetical protein
LRLNRRLQRRVLAPWLGAHRVNILADKPGRMDNVPFSEGFMRVALAQMFCGWEEVERNLDKMRRAVRKLRHH